MKPEQILPFFLKFSSSSDFVFLISNPKTLTPVGDFPFFTNPTSHFLSFSAYPLFFLVFLFPSLLGLHCLLISRHRDVYSTQPP